MVKNLLFTSFLFFSSFIAIYPSKKEDTNLFDYCYSFEKILSRNFLEKNKNLSNKANSFAKKLTVLGTDITKGDLSNKILDQYKNSKNKFIITFVPNKFYCLAGYWIEKVNPGTFASIFYEKSKERINEYNDIKKEVNEFIDNINSEYEFIKKEINDFF